MKKAISIQVRGFLPVLTSLFVLAFVLGFSAPSANSQNSRSSINSHKARTKAVKHTARRPTGRRAKSDGTPDISGAKPVKPWSTIGNLTGLPQIGPSLAEKERDQEEIERLPPPAQKKKPLPGVIDPENIASFQPVNPTTPTPGANFVGLDYANWGSGFPPDTVGDVGPNHFVQAVNSSFAVYNKTGTRLVAMTFNTLWTGAGAGTACSGANQGDPTVIYDPANNRWIVADFAFSNTTTGPFYECIAVSKTADPTGAWWLYAYRADDAAHNWLPDYPKMGIWPDGLYMSANMFQGSTFKEVRAYAFNMADMIAGAPMRSVFIDLNSTAYFSLLPSNYRGTPPPANRENIFVGESGSAFAFNVFKFKPNYTTPASSTWVAQADVSQASYTGSTGSVPTSGNSLDTVNADGLKMQNQYRNIGGAESLWVHHNTLTAAGGVNGVQWAQINVTGGTVVTTPVQQQIYGNLSSDTQHRWMQSLAVDRVGNMLLGYSAANATNFPSIRYNGRLVTDPLNTLPQGEIILQAGGGTAVGNCGTSACTRWGDYSAMSVDPVDDCTFWYTTEYMAANGLAWSTRIGSVKFPTCTAASTNRTPFDYDGDGKTDASVYRSSNNAWYLLRSTAGFSAFQFGAAGDSLVPADYTGDGKTDIAIWRPSNGSWYILKSEDSTLLFGGAFGTNGDVAVPADYDGDGKADIAVYRPGGQAYWYLQQTTAGFSVVPFGTTGDVPALGDYDGDRKADVSVYRPSLGQWFRFNSSTGTFYGVQFGAVGDKIVPGDYTGDGKADNAVFRPSTNTWYVLRSETPTFYGAVFGAAGDVPAPGDYDGDGKYDLAVWRPGAQGTFYIQQSTAGFSAIPWGLTGDRPTANAYVY